MQRTSSILVTISILISASLPVYTQADEAVIQKLTSQTWARVDTDIVDSVRNGEELEPGFYQLLAGTGAEVKLNEPGKALQDAYHWALDPGVVCVKPGMPRIAAMPSLYEFVFDEGQLQIHYEYMDVWRTIHLDVSEVPENVAHTPIGYSVGRFENGALLIKTTNISPGIHGLSGIPKSGAITILEEFRPIEENGQYYLYGSITVDDPFFLLEPFSGEYGGIESQYEIIKYECYLESFE